MNYQEWIAENNYGQDPAATSSLKSSKSLIQPNANDPGPGGILGHAAIAASNEHVLDVPGTADAPEHNNSRMRTLSKWISQYAVSGRWVQIYRMEGHPNLAYADMNNKNIHLTYEITSELYTLNPMYCSKLVFQAYYDGTGSYSVLFRIEDFYRLIMYPIYGSPIIA
ncbi:MAG: YiiX/YebB-like N1pC/P60 family cysteine hydrolase [Sporolactobacillus sp.]